MDQSENFTARCIYRSSIDSSRDTIIISQEMNRYRSLSINGLRFSRWMRYSSLQKTNNGYVVSNHAEPNHKDRRQFYSSETKSNIEYLPMIHFASTPFFPILKDVLINEGFQSPTSIQSQSWPVALKRRDIISVARTGSGKTFGFLLPAFQKLLIAKELEMVIILMMADNDNDIDNNNDIDNDSYKMVNNDADNEYDYADNYADRNSAGALVSQTESKSLRTDTSSHKRISCTDRD